MRQESIKQEFAGDVGQKKKGWGKNVLHILILIGMLGFDWDGGSSVGMYPNFMDLFDISIVLYQKERFVNLHFFLDLI